MGEMTSLPVEPLWATLILAPLILLFSLLSAMVERSGPVRMRSWAEEAGGRLEALYEARDRFEAYRYLLSLIAKVLPVLWVLAVEALLSGLGIGAALVWSVVVVALLLALGEVINRLLVQALPEPVLLRLTPVYRVFLLLSAPLLAILAPLFTGGTAERRDEEEEEEASEGEIEAFLDFGAREGILEPGEEELVRGIVDFGDTQVRSVMTPRIDVHCASVETRPEELRTLFLESGHSRIPLYDGSIDRVVGILHIRDLLRALGSLEARVPNLVKPPLFVPETKQLSELLKEMQASHQQMAIVVDEYGGTSGLVTIEDLLEEIVGEITDEHEEEEPEVEELADGSWRVDGRAHVETLEDLFDVDLGDVSSETVGGLIFSTLGDVPTVGETVDVAGLKLWVESLEDRRIRTVRVERTGAGRGAAAAEEVAGPVEE